MNMNDDNFFDDIQDDIQESDNGINNSYQVQNNKKTKLILTVVISFVIGLVMLGILLFFLSGDKDEDMVSINSFPQQNSQFQGVKKLESENNSVNMGNNNNMLNTSPDVSTIHNDMPTHMNEKKVVPVKKVVKRKVIAKKKVVNKKPVVVTVSKKIVETKPLIKGMWKVQLISAQDRDNNSAELKERMITFWDKLVKDNPVLKNHTYDIEQKSIKGTVWYRLRIVGLKNSTEATDLCNDLKNNNVACVIVK